MKITTGINTSTGEPIQIRVGDVADIRYGETATEIVRENLVRQIRIDGNPMNRSVGDVSKDIEQVLEPSNGAGLWLLGRRRCAGLGGVRRTCRRRILAVFIYMVLASQFNGFIPADSDRAPAFVLSACFWPC